MADVVDAATRSRMMSGIRGRDTAIEIAIRKSLHARGFRYRIGVRSLPGRPDIVLPRWKVVILVHGCFWHSHDCGLSRVPATRSEFWRQKLTGNAERDRRNHAALARAGWRIATVWECCLRGSGADALDKVTGKLTKWIKSGDPQIEIRK